VTAYIVGLLQIFYYEEEEASRRDPDKDSELHQNVCLELRRTMLDIKQLKSVGHNTVCLLCYVALV